MGRAPKRFSLIQEPPTFEPRWKYKLPTQFRHKDLGFFLTEYFNNSCAESFLEDSKYERCVIPIIRNMLEGI